MESNMLMQTRQQGGSAIGLIIFLAIFAYGVFVGLQYVPQYIESATVTTMLDTLVEKHSKQPLENMSAVQGAINNQLFINQMQDLESSFKVTQYRGDFIITVRFERELNLMYQTKLMPFEKTVTLE
jgi:hypothetical protein